MSYTPTEWQTGDTITAEKLNNMESGIENANEPFLVTLTPTAQDFSGTMDKTVGEINAAYEAGRKIVFRVYTSATTYIEVECITRGRNVNEGNYPSFNAYVIDVPNSVLVYMYTGVSAIASTNTYFTLLFTLTPMT